MTLPPKAQQVDSWCREMPGATVDNTFGHETNVHRVGDRIFALVNLEPGTYITLKTLPEEGEALRARYDSVRPGYYMNKRHWITVDLVPEAPMGEVRELIHESYRLVFESLPKKRRAELRPE